MSESSETKKINGWVVGLLVFLLVALVGETGYLIKLHLDERRNRTSSEEYSASSYPVKPIAPPIANPMGAIASPVSPFGFTGRGSNQDEWDPFREMEEMQRSMNRLFRDSYSRGLRTTGSDQSSLTYNPDLDVRETDKEYLLRLDLPGIDKDKISVKVENNQIVVSGERQSEKEQSDQQGGFYQTERSFGSFVRSFPLPADADGEKMIAESKNGVLTVHIPKIAGAKKTSSTISVQ